MKYKIIVSPELELNHIKELVDKGAKFITFQYCISVITSYSIHYTKLYEVICSRQGFENGSSFGMKQTLLLVAKQNMVPCKMSMCNCIVGVVF